jgi:hypothetical protein
MKYTEEQVEALAWKVLRLQEEIAGLKYDKIILESQLQIKRGEIIQLKSLVGHMNNHIKDIQTPNNIIDIEYE